MAKTIAELSEFYAILSQRLDNAQEATTVLKADHRRLTDSLHAARLEAVEQRGLVTHLRREFDVEQSLGREREQAIADLRQENAVLRRQLDDYLKRVETWSGRLWGLVPVLLGAILSLASGLIVTLVMLAKK